MTDAPSSPRRRHILSSINPDTRSVSPKIEIEAQRHVSAAPPFREEEPRDAEERRPESTTSPTAEAPPPPKEKKTTTKFRFKSKHSRSHRSSRHRDRSRSHNDRDEEEGSDLRRSHKRDRDRDHADGDHKEGESSSSRRHRHHHRRHHHHRHKRRRSRSRSRSATPPNPYEPPPLDPEAAFRESLFDAMADDEGAAYWEGVYGQPMHVYSRQSQGAGPDGGGDSLERMDDDEYAAYVRQKMWEKTHQGILEERARREERRRQEKEKEKEARRLTKQMEESLRRGEERRVRKSWKERWEKYTRAWDPWDGTLEGLAWPTKSGRREDVGTDEVRDFYVLGIDPVEVGEKEFLAKLKEERVRWHPDKIQQRLGGRDGVEEAVMRDVTAVFQIVDKLWSDTRSKQTR